ncbi:MAG: pyridoxamine 5'-phosphate oxidase family protein [Sulfuricaulis sp.]
MKNATSDLPATCRDDIELTAQRLFHDGHRRAQALYADPARAERIINAMPDITSLSEEQIGFLEGLPFFFLATSDGAGHMQCNFKGGGPRVLRAGNSRTLYYPEYPGNDMMLSVGNLLQYPYVGILGLCFQTRRRLKVNGRAEVLAMNDGPYAEWWPDARLVIRVHINEVIRNCSRRIPHLMPVVEPTDQHLTDSLRGTHASLR